MRRSLRALTHRFCHWLVATHSREFGSKSKAKDDPFRSTPSARPLWSCDRTQDLNTREPIDSFTILTVLPNAFLGTVHDRASLVGSPAD